MEENFSTEEKQSAEKNPSPKIIYLEPKTSLRRFYLHIEDLTPYENVPLTTVGFKPLIMKRLTENGYETLGKLLKSTRKQLLNMKKIGANTFDEILSTLKNFFATQYRDIPAEISELTGEELEEFLRYEISKPDAQANLIIAALERLPLSESAEKFFGNLPDEFGNKRAQPFLVVCGLDKIKLPTEVTLAQLPTHHEFTAEELKTFVSDFYFDIRAHVKKFIASLFNKQREYEVLFRRMRGGRLEQIGREVGLTRERVRQIELAAVARFASRLPEVLKIFHFLRALNDGRSFLTLAELKTFLDAVDAELIFFLAAKMNFKTDVLYFDAELKAFVFHGEIELNEDELTKNLPDIMDEKFFNEVAENLAREKNCAVELIKSKVLKVYKHSGKFFHRNRLSSVFKCSYVLREKFPEGYKISDKNCYLKAVREYRELFGVEEDPTRRSIDAMIGRLGVLVGRGEYIHPDNFHAPKELADRVKEFVDSSDRAAISYREIFKALKKFFVGTPIKNPYVLQGMIKFYKLPYTLRKDYLTKADEVSVDEEFKTFVAERGEVSRAEIHKRFFALSRLNLDVMIKRCPEVLYVGNQKVMHSSLLNLREEDFAPIKNFLRQSCTTPVSARVLLKIFKEAFAEFMTRNDIQTSEKLFSVLRHMFGDEFNFSRPYISTDSRERITNKKILLKALEDMECVEIEMLFDIRGENAMGHATKTYLVETMSPEFVRIDKFTLARPESVGITAEIVAAVAEVVRAAMERNGGWLVSQAFNDYERLPKLAVPWNNFLLAGVMLLDKNATRTLRIPSTTSTISGIIFLSEEFAEDDFQSFIKKIITSRHEKIPFHSEKEVLTWLKSNYLCHKSLPRFLKGETLSKILA